MLACRLPRMMHRPHAAGSPRPILLGDVVLPDLSRRCGPLARDLERVLTGIGRVQRTEVALRDRLVGAPGLAVRARHRA